MGYIQTHNPLSRNSSPLNKHGEWQKKIDAARAKWDKEKPEGDFYEVHADLFKKQEEARKAHKEDGPSRKSSSPVNFMGIKRPGRCTPFPNPDCEPGTPQYNLAKRLKPGGDLYKGKKK